MSEPIEPMHWLRGRRDDEAACGADRRRKRTTRQIDLVTCPECRPELVETDQEQLLGVTGA